MNSEAPKDFISQLTAAVAGHVEFDAFTRGRYATDASVYQMMPVGVVTPKTIADIHAVISLAKDYGIPITARGGGTSQCGQTVNRSLIVDNSRYLNQLLDLDIKNHRCTVEPGMILDDLNRQLKPHGLWFPVDVSTSSRATIGGMAANNSCGQRSLKYGTMRHNVHSIEAIMATGDQWHFGHTEQQPTANASQQALLNELLTLGRQEADEIEARFPKLLRRVGGYNIDALVPNLQNTHNLAHLLVGSEGTLAYSTAIELKISPLPVHTVMGICHFPTFYQAMEATQHLVALGPVSVELIDNTMIDLARNIPLYRSTIDSFIRGEPAAVLLVEFAHDDQQKNLQALQLLCERMAELGYQWNAQPSQKGGVIEAINSDFQTRINNVRKAGLNIMMSMKSEGKPVSFVEDCAVELKDLADYTAELTELFKSYKTTGTWYAHASVGCLHVRPILNLKLDKDASTMREIAEKAFDLVLKYKGSHSGEHGDGISRSEFNEKIFGPRIVRAFQTVKTLFDPANQFNPGKITNAPRMNDRTLFRYAPGYSMSDVKSRLDWSEWTGAGGGLQGAVEMCNNNGACRSLKGGLMCPSYRVTKDEKDSTRGRANTLRLALSGQLGETALSSDAMHDTMKLCVSCKGCKRECPTGVDMAKMKIEVQAAHAQVHGHTFHERIIAHLPRYAPAASRMRRLSNLPTNVPFIRKLLEPITGFCASRPLPQWHANPFRDNSNDSEGEKDVVLLADTFNRWFEPDNIKAARHVLQAAGFRTHIAQLPGQRNLCCGRTYLATGMIKRARHEAKRMIEALLPWAIKGVPIVGLEPSCLLTLRDEYRNLIPGTATDSVANQAMLLEELIVKEAEAGELNWILKAPAQRAYLHGHCHQKAMGVFSTVEQALALIPDLDITTIESGCCGMAGAFGYASDTAETSMAMAELDLLPLVRRAEKDSLIVADGTSCRHQISMGTDRQAMHVAQILALSLKVDTH
jgi:FAD/FMN-containing dehydrogenase/Fe-S oxidoreductase